MKPKKRIQSDDFSAFLVDQVPYFDKLIMEDMRPTDAWIMHVDAGRKVGFWLKLWWIVRCVWVMLAWLFRPTIIHEKPISTVESTQDRFAGVYPKIKASRKNRRAPKTKKKKGKIVYGPRPEYFKRKKK